jgi:hypothetical protein
MRILLGLAALTVCLAMPVEAASVDAAKVAEVRAASEAFVALAKTTPQAPPRQSDPAVRAAFDVLFDTSVLEEGDPLPLADLANAHAWAAAVLKVGTIYLFAGTGITDPSQIPVDPGLIQTINRNATLYAPEIGRYVDTQLKLAAAILDAVDRPIKILTREQRDQPRTRQSLAQIRHITARALAGALHLVTCEEISESWRRARLAPLLALASRTGTILSPELAAAIRAKTLVAAATMKDPVIRTALNQAAAALAPR